MRVEKAIRTLATLDGELKMIRHLWSYSSVLHSLVPEPNHHFRTTSFERDASLRVSDASRNAIRTLATHDGESGIRKGTVIFIFLSYLFFLDCQGELFATVELYNMFISLVISYKV